MTIQVKKGARVSRPRRSVPRTRGAVPVAPRSPFHSGIGPAARFGGNPRHTEL